VLSFKQAANASKYQENFTVTMKKYKSEISGHLDIFIADKEDEFEGKILKWQDILIHGDPEGLKSFAKLLMRIADLNQDDSTGLPIDAREHIHLRPNYDISKSSTEVIIGRIDAKGTGVFYDRYIARDDNKKATSK
jgi:hypothetical protein